MGVPLFDFAANIGKKVFNPGVSGLAVAVNDGTAKISGTAKDAAAFEKAVLIAGNVVGVAKVEAADLGDAKAEP